MKRLYKGEEKNVHVTLVESKNILNSFDEHLRVFAEKKIRSRSRFHLVQASVNGNKWWFSFHCRFYPLIDIGEESVILVSVGRVQWWKVWIIRKSRWSIEIWCMYVVPRIPCSMLWSVYRGQKRVEFSLPSNACKSHDLFIYFQLYIQKQFNRPRPRRY